MTLLEFARGPGMQWALVIFLLGVVWRLVGSFLLWRKRDLAKPKGTAYAKAGARAMIPACTRWSIASIRAGPPPRSPKSS